METCHYSSLFGSYVPEYFPGTNQSVLSMASKAFHGLLDKVNSYSAQQCEGSEVNSEWWQELCERAKRHRDNAEVQKELAKGRQLMQLQYFYILAGDQRKVELT